MTTASSSAGGDCTGCTACCRIMGVRELDKAPNVACRHCIAGVGCREYDARPASCRTFRCVWLQTQDTAAPLAPALRPDRSRVVMSTADAGETIVLNVAPDRREAWRQGAMGERVARMLRDRVKVLLKCGERVQPVPPPDARAALTAVAPAPIVAGS